MEGLSDKTIVVTGGAGGIGLATVQRLVTAGSRVVIADLVSSNGESIATELNEGRGMVHFMPVDVTSVASLTKVADEVVTRFGAIDGVVANAGIAVMSEAFAYNEASWRQTMGVNLDGAFFTAQSFARHMRGRGGSVVLISSIAARSVVQPEKCAAYGATKAAVEHLAALLGVEWARDGIRVNAVGPGRTETPMIERIAKESPEMVATWMEQVPIGRLIRPEEVANAVAFFLSDLSSGCNGTTLMVDGGYDKT
ncbi:SDR family NAD(P)-dependent oxidoreductase [Paraburkholderia hospita]|uniref:KR domain-containing protein n=1 Tax=Paraburkholderia hospita TaxID=169430 RepID=A0AAN1JN96_9BURK|nr:SDR family oxidoreductase [Paraburkholderia hospita]AUT76249.1 KR domain-containing protein [Paraburkholderia hospita]SEI17703.1 sorbose reductase [Paraburkholderia hospita]